MVQYYEDHASLYDMALANLLVHRNILNMTARTVTNELLEAIDQLAPRLMGLPDEVSLPTRWATLSHFHGSNVGATSCRITTTTSK